VLATPSEQAEQDALLEWLKSSSHKQQAQRDDEVGFRQYLQAGRRSSLDQALLKLLLPPARSSVPGVYALDPTDRVPGRPPCSVPGCDLSGWAFGVGVSTVRRPRRPLARPRQHVERKSMVVHSQLISWTSWCRPVSHPRS
jgi:hypothetical protein